MIAALVLAACLAQEPEPGQAVAVETPDVVASWVVGDMATLDADTQDEVFYLWLPRARGAQASWHHVGAFAVNTAISRAARPIRPTVIAAGWLQRWDLRVLVPDPVVRARVRATLDEAIAADPFFRNRDCTLASFVAAAIAGPAGALGLTELPVMRLDYALEAMLSNIGRGKYLEFRFAISASPDDGRTEEEIALAVFGVHREAAEAVRGDDRVAVFASEVTDKSRIAERVRGLVGDAWVTDDLIDENAADELRHAIYNLLTPTNDGHEWIIEMPNGFHAFLITDSSGKILREAPDALVADHEVPRPSTTRLEGAMSCIRCHGSEAGLKAVPNNVEALCSQGLDVLVDGGIVDSLQAAEEIAARYAGRDFERSLRHGRERYELAVDELTGGELDVAGISKLTADVFGQWRYPRFSARQALADVGVAVATDAEAVALFRQLAAPLEPRLPGVAVLEDPTIFAIGGGVRVHSRDWYRVFVPTFERVIARRSAVR